MILHLKKLLYYSGINSYYQIENHWDILFVRATVREREQIIIRDDSKFEKKLFYCDRIRNFFSTLKVFGLKKQVYPLQTQSWHITSIKIIKINMCTIQTLT